VLAGAFRRTATSARAQRPGGFFPTKTLFHRRRSQGQRETEGVFASGKLPASRGSSGGSPKAVRRAGEDAGGPRKSNRNAGDDGPAGWRERLAFFAAGKLPASRGGSRRVREAPAGARHVPGGSGRLPAPSGRSRRRISPARGRRGHRRSQEQRRRRLRARPARLAVLRSALFP